MMLRPVLYDIRCLTEVNVTREGEEKSTKLNDNILHLPMLSNAVIDITA